jgi:lipopolysaccharide export LptBFGC system permease protein LptF
MKIIHRYILFSVAGTFLITLFVLTGILCLGNLLKVADLIIRGMDPVLILKFLGFLVISLLEYAIPMAILTSTILVFGRLAADNEITGMRACGIGLKQIIEPVVFFGLGLTLLCLYLQNTAIPNYSFATKKLRAQIGLQDPDTILQPGKTIALPGCTINFEFKEDGFLHRIQINQYKNQELISTIFAKKAAIELDQGKEGFILQLFDGTVEEITDRDNPQVRITTTFGNLNYPISLEKLYAAAYITEEDKRKKDMTSGELLLLRRQLLKKKSEAERELEETRRELLRLAEIRRAGEKAANLELMANSLLLFPNPTLLIVRPDHPILPQALYSSKTKRMETSVNPARRVYFTSPTIHIAETIANRSRLTAESQRLLGKQLKCREEISRCTTEFQERLSLSAACLAMIFISIPLAIQSHRSEKTIGMALSLALLFIFYIFVAYADAVAGEPGKLPFLIIWIPNLFFSMGGCFWMVKFTRI